MVESDATEQGASSSPSRAGRSRWAIRLLLAALLVAAVGWRVHAARTVVFPSVDGVTYLTVARDLWREGSLRFSTFPPGWPLLVSVPLVALDAGDPAQLLRSAQLVNVIAGTTAGLMVFLLLCRRAGAGLGLLGATVFLVVPENIMLSTGDLSEMSYVNALLGAWLLWERRSESASGFVFGLAYLIRPEALLVFAALLVHRWVSERRPPLRALLTSALVVAPYVLFMHDATGQWMPSSKSAFVEVAVEDRAAGEVARQWLRNAASLLEVLPASVGLPIVGLCLWGAALRRGLWLYGLLPLLLLPLFTFRMESRYWVPALPFVVLGAGLGARDLVGRLPTTTLRRPAAALLIAVAIAGVLMSASGKWMYVGANHEYFPGMRDAGLWLAERAGPEDVVAGYKPYVSFWSGCRFRRIPDDRTAAAVVNWARENAIDYLVVNVHLTSSVTPQLRPLLRELPPNLARKITLVHVAQIDGDSRQATLVYRVEPLGPRRS